MDFYAVDIETATYAVASICQIGIVGVSGGKIVEEWETLIDPETDFSPFHIHVHGITAEKVRGAPRMCDVAGKIHAMLSSRVVDCHGTFDQSGITQALGALEIDLHCDWLDTAHVARGTWDDCAKYGAKLGSTCRRLGIPLLQHHNALCDARASAHIALMAAEAHNTTVRGLFEKYLCAVHKKYNPKDDTPNPDGPFFGQRIAFTGSLSCSRSEASNMALRLGFEVTESISKKVSVLVAGKRDFEYLCYGEKSAKLLKAEKLIAQGIDIRLLAEDDFFKLTE